jgi:hypothetical protein
MSQAYRTFFGLTREPFSSDLKIEEILKTAMVLSVADRVDYAIRLKPVVSAYGSEFMERVTRKDP